MNILSNLWLSLGPLFDPVQYFFNGSFWEVFCKKFDKYTRGEVIDLACGTGEMRKWVKSTKYLGIDMNASYIQYAKERFTEKNTKFINGDITKANLKGSGSTALIISAVHHLSDKQLTDTFKNLKKHKIKNLVIVDGYPQGPLSGVLAWLDAVLAGGEYFRKEDEISKLVKPHYKIKEKGRFFAKRSFYFYPFVIATSSR